MKEEDKKELETEKKKPETELEKMASAGLHYGHKSSGVHPKMKPYLYGVRNNIHLIDLEITKEKLKEALKVIEKLVTENKTILVVGTKIQIQGMVKDFAEECGFFYANLRWLGGTITNFDIIKKRIKHFKDLEGKMERGELEKYTKREKDKMKVSLGKFEKRFGGIKYMEKIPDALLVLGMKKDAIAIKEARTKKVTIIGIADSDTDPTLANYFIPANDDAVSSIKYILDEIKEVVLKVKPKVQTVEPEVTSTEETGDSKESEVKKEL